MHRISPQFLSAISEWSCTANNAERKTLITWNVTHPDDLFLEGYRIWNVNTHTLMHKHALTYTHMYACAHRYLHHYTHMHAHMRPLMHTCEHTHTHACADTHTQHHTQTNTHTELARQIILRIHGELACWMIRRIPLSVCLPPPFWQAYSKWERAGFVQLSGGATLLPFHSRNSLLKHVDCPLSMWASQYMRYS